MESVALDQWLEQRNVSAELPADTVITANHRLARHLLNRYRNYQAASGVFENPGVAAFDQWLAEQWLLAQETGEEQASVALLSPQQELLLWRNEVERDGAASSLMTSPAALAKALLDADSTAVLWYLGDEDLCGQATDETLMFLRLRDSFLAACERGGWVSRARATERLADLYQRGVLPRQQTIQVYGFTDLPPAYSTLLSAAANQVKQLSANEHPAELRALCFADYREELEAAARWCKETLADKPTARIGIIVPRLHQTLDEVENAFLQEFCAEQYQNPIAAEQEAPFELSIGRPLLDQPAVADAMALWQALTGRIDRDEALYLSQSRFWGDGQSSARLILSRHLRLFPGQTLRLSALVEWLAKAERSAGEYDVPVAESSPGPCWSERMAKYLSVQRAGRRTAQQWCEQFRQFLEDLGWPGPTTVNSREYQAIEQFMQELDALSGYGMVLEESEDRQWSLADFTRLLREQLASRVFQPQRRPGNIQVLGALEGLGLEFDCLWMVDATDKNLPAPPSPNPFLPIVLQKARQTPRADVSRELEFARDMLRAFAGCAPQVVFSYGRLDGEEHRQLTPLLTDLFADRLSEATPAASDNPVTSTYRAALNSVQQEKNAEREGLPLPASPVRRGVQTLALQGKNPAYAYLIHRLGVDDEPVSGAGLPAWVRGQVIHNVLAQIWQEMRDSDGLATALAQPDALAQNLRDLCEREMQSCLARQRFDVPAQYVDGEVARNARLITHWLEQEANREPFSVVAIEQAFHAGIGPLRFLVRVDRADKLADGSVVLIDYKTGNVTSSPLTRLPLTEPQLPVYATLNEFSPVQAVAFARLHAKACSFAGIGELPTPVKGITSPASLKQGALPADWSEALDWWRDALEEVARGFSAGNAEWRELKGSDKQFLEHLAPIARDFDQQVLSSDTADGGQP